MGLFKLLMQLELMLVRLEQLVLRVQLELKFEFVLLADYLLIICVN